MSDGGEKRLPSAWAVLTLGEVRLDQSRGIVPSKQPNDMFELYSVPSFDLGKPEIVQGQSIGSNKQTVETDTVLLCKINPRINRVWVVENHSSHSKIASTEWIPFFRSAFLPKYLCYYMRRDEFRDHLASQASGVGGSLMRIKASTLAGYPLPIAPFLEQQRIVTKIEELFSELDKGIESLKTARAKLDVYRQAVLKHAFEGKLTAQWREMHSAVPWTQTTLGSQLSFLTSGSRGWAKFYAEQGDKFIRAQNLKHDRLDLADIAFVDLPNKSEGMRTRIQIGDLLITITGANVTKTAFVASDIGAAYVSQHVALARPVEGSNTEFLYWYLVSEAAGRKQLTDSAYGAGKPGLNLENIRSVKLPLPGPEEQTEIVAQINSILSIERSLSAQIDIQLARLDALRQSILKKAFTGQLVAQDPDDEPASILLERIKAENAARSQNNTRARRRRAAATA